MCHGFPCYSDDNTAQLILIGLSVCGLMAVLIVAVWGIWYCSRHP